MAEPSASSGTHGGPVPGRSREVFAWAMYDWANSAYSTLSITILVYYITKVVVPEDWGSDWGFDGGSDRGAVVWAWGISLSMLVAALLSPVLGAIADANSSKRKWLAATALSGAAGAVLLAAMPPGQTVWIIALFVLVSFFFELSLGFYNGFLPEISDQQTVNRVSAWGYALGYIGGALALVLALVVSSNGERLGLIEESSQLRAGIAIMGVWWGLFTIPTLWVLRDRGPAPPRKLTLGRSVAEATGEVVHTLRHIWAYRMLAMFLLGFLFYNDGIQTVISQSSVFATKELDFELNELVLLILMIQVLAFPGAILIGRLADRIGQKTTLMVCLGVWVALVVSAFVIHSKTQFWILGVILAIVLGGTQSVSRAIMGMMTPPQRSAEFFGFFNFSGKATSFLGAFVFGLIVDRTGSPRLAILSLLVFLLIGWGLVAFVDVRHGRQQALRA